MFEPSFHAGDHLAGAANVQSDLRASGRVTTSHQPTPGQGKAAVTGAEAWDEQNTLPHAQIGDGVSPHRVGKQRRDSQDGKEDLFTYASACGANDTLSHSHAGLRSAALDGGRQRGSLLVPTGYPLLAVSTQTHIAAFGDTREHRLCRTLPAHAPELDRRARVPRPGLRTQAPVGCRTAQRQRTGERPSGSAAAASAASHPSERPSPRASTFSRAKAGNRGRTHRRRRRPVDHCRRHRGRCHRRAGGGRAGGADLPPAPMTADQVRSRVRPCPTEQGRPSQRGAELHKASAGMSTSNCARSRLVHEHSPGLSKLSTNGRDRQPCGRCCRGTPARRR